MSSFYQHKKMYCLLAMVFLFAFNMASGQGYNTTNWRFSNPKQFGFSVFDLDYFDNNNVIAVGNDGGIAKSTDGGSNWTYGPFTYLTPLGLQTKSTFNDVHYVTATVAYAVGDRGSMAKTTDGGLNWVFVNNPLFPGSKNINACWFLDANKGYIGGDPNNAVDSLPRLYVTLNGGATWDSIAPPAVNGVSRVGYINNPNIPSVLWPVDAKLKSINRIEFINDSTGYVCGSNSYGVTLFPNVSLRATSATVCTPLTTFLTSGSMGASLLWKFRSGVLTDYSLSKERLGYTGINTSPITCATGYGNITPSSQTYRALNIINDSLVVMMSSNNNTVVRVRTGRNDSTANVNAAGAFEKGKYEVLNYPFPPTAGPNAGPPIPPVQNLFASNPYHMIRNTAGTLVTGTFNNIGGPGYLWTSTDTGRTWTQRSVYPQGRNWSPVAAAPALDFAPGGKLLVMGNNGIVGDSTAGGAWQSNYLTVPVGASYNDIEFADCNNGIAAGGSSITITTDGGKNWVDKANSALAGLFANITSVTYPQVNKVYFTTNIGTIYRSVNQGTNLVPAFIDNYGGTSTINDLAIAGNDSIWACGAQQNFTIPAAQRFGLVYRSFNNGVSWDTIRVGPQGTTGTQAQQFVTFRGIEFPSRTVGYACGTRGAVYKTTNAGATWINISPFPAVNISPAGFANSAVSYSDIIALDNNTVFVVGNMFTSANNRRIYKTTDGGANWVDISSNIDLLSGGNLNGILMHDVNNGYVTVPGGVLYKTTNGGASWIMDLAPSATLTTPLAFAPKTVPASISMVNRRLFVAGANINGAPILEYGTPANINVNATEAVVNPTCSNLSGGSITVNATGGITPYTYSINGGAFQASNVFSGLTQGVKSIIIRDAFCGTLTKSVTVGFNDNLTLTTSNDTSVCAGAPVPLIATSAATSYAWTPAAGLSNAAISNPVAIVQGNTSYTVTATLNGCVRTKTINITIRPNPIINAGADKTIVDGDAVMLDGSGNANSISVAWTPAATLTGANTYTPAAKPNLTTVYTLTVRDANGCTSTDNATVTVIPYCIKIMNAFTPNGDGINDKWLVTNGAPCSNQIIATVFNRYGSPVFKSDNYQNAWDGTYKGKPVPDGTYYYAVTYRLINGRSLTLKGDVTILR
jgi:gliding motility-associated-like protein